MSVDVYTIFLRGEKGHTVAFQFQKNQKAGHHVLLLTGHFVTCLKNWLI